MGKKKIGKHNHKGVRDILKQREEREKKLFHKINNPPKEDQPLSKKFRKFIELKNSAKSGDVKLKKKSTVNDDFSKVDSEFAVKKMSNETTSQQFMRVEQNIKRRMLEAEYAKKYNIDIVRDNETGEIKMKKKKVEKNNPGKVVKKKADPVPETPEEVAYAPVIFKSKKKLKDDDLGIKRDVVKFGEVVKGPPNLKFPRKFKNPIDKTKLNNFLIPRIS